jgi:DNA-directed RNA polymerase specialized sigma24 family protein
LSIDKERNTMASTHYVNNADFLQEMIIYKKMVKSAEAENKERPRVPEYIGTCLFKIATHLARKPNFANYTFKEDMISDGIENCLMYIDNFDPEKYSNPFAYFTQIIYYAFLRRIQKEKKHMYIRYKSMQNEIINVLVDNAGEEFVASHMSGMINDAYSDNFIKEFIDAFETNKKNKTPAPKKKAAKGVIKFMENEENEQQSHTIASAT